VAIISRGSFVAPGKIPAEGKGERKLYLLIEGSSELMVKQARLEIQRLLDEETMRVSASASAAG
jgi:ATP-dependent RNA helicase DDX46/PRP5